MYHLGGSSTEVWSLKIVPPVAFNWVRTNLMEGGLNVPGGDTRSGPARGPCRRDEHSGGGSDVWNVAGQTGWFDDLGIFSSHAANNAYNSGIEYLERGQYNQAIVNFDEAIRLDPQYANAYYNRGHAYGKRGLYEQAILDFDAYIRLDPDDSGAFFERAYAYDELGQYERAIKDLDEAIRLDPEYAVAYNNRGVAYQNLGHQEPAE